MAMSANITVSLLIMAMILAHSKSGAAEMTGTDVNIPDKIGAWIKSDTVERIDSNNIFQYMNGAGELYLGYRFDHLDVYEFKGDKKKPIQVEVYYMKSSDDAFGLLSLDWSGEAVSFGLPGLEGKNAIAPTATALYGTGLLRMRMENKYVRILSMLETPEIRDAILSLGEAMRTGSEPAPEPGLLKVLPPVLGGNWKLRNDRIGWLRSHLVLNSLYYISHRNILDLDHSVEAVTAPYETMSASGAKRVQILMIKYVSEEHCIKALSHFYSAYLPEYETSDTGLHSLEDGWLGCKRVKNNLAIIFQCPDEVVARGFISQISFHP